MERCGKCGIWYPASMVHNIGGGPLVVCTCVDGKRPSTNYDCDVPPQGGPEFSLNKEGVVTIFFSGPATT